MWLAKRRQSKTIRKTLESCVKCCAFLRAQDFSMALYMQESQLLQYSHCMRPDVEPPAEKAMVANQRWLRVTNFTCVHSMIGDGRGYKRLT